ncbi:MAG: NAD(+) synthase [Candidatus Thermoplasmatota archaeon]|nr:NAD(+) synthase [Candidatus Thalassarchaeaceae archaeon]MEC7104655.1 NAD(+) synthase [Candidatus Thermoplasmatota archaeon]MEC7364955.1 NAD(+) synthase [Candidatus Thermoplasmatota archaeon]MEC7425364.1 NAD(+) synthase [Candidatus Thermoplasmatota archaeon]MEC7459066.1 NAD(+) synthase [Candidatus Thermoplasmatota archaeon]|tara:strand:+ start:1210 stop:1986 length:777 start_codon:yes stop_codon:yes gene_type:complete
MRNWNILAEEITNWISDYALENDIRALVVGVSGGVDSAVTSTLSARTGIRTIVLNMPIHQKKYQDDLSKKHISWLKDNFNNVEERIVNLSKTYDSFVETVSVDEVSDIALANSRARLRMTALYATAGSNGGIVVGTGNKVEDFGVGFYTKYGDGGVDISPIADLLKTEVYQIARELDIIEEIIQAAPTDGLWGDGRSDEEQLGASYEELEWAMKESKNPSNKDLSEREKDVLGIYQRLNKLNSHKMNPIPIFKLYPSD